VPRYDPCHTSRPHLPDSPADDRIMSEADRKAWTAAGVSGCLWIPGVIMVIIVLAALIFLLFA